MRGLPRLRSVLNSKLNPPATFNYLSILSSSTLGFNFWGSKTVFLGIVDVLKVAASPCTWLHGCRPAAPPLKRQPRRKGSSTAAPRPRDAAMAGPGPEGTAGSSSGRRAGADKCDSLHKAAAAAAALTSVPAELHAGGPLTGRRRCSASSIEREREGREPQRGKESPARPAAAERRSLARWRSLRGELPSELDSFPVLPRRRVVRAAPVAFFPRAPVTQARRRTVSRTSAGDGSVRAN